MLVTRKISKFLSLLVFYSFGPTIQVMNLLGPHGLHCYQELQDARKLQQRWSLICSPSSMSQEKLMIMLDL